MASPKQTLYDILGVPRDANEIDVGLAYERRKAALAREAGTDPNALTLLREAYEVLKDPKRRAAYDASLVTAEARTAAQAQETPDLVLEPEEAQAAPRKIPFVPLAIGALVILAGIVIALRPGTTPAPATPPQAAAPPPQPAPPPPTPKSAVEVMADATTSGGVLLSYAMSGQSVVLGLAMSTESGTMITTCHGIPAGAKLVVRVGKGEYPVELAITDEQLDLCKLQVSNFGTPPLKVSTAEPKAGDRIFAVGANKAGALAVTEGTVKQVLNTTEGNLIELSMPVGEFSSGGGVFDTYGRLIGIQTFQHRSNLAVAYPAARIAQMRSRPQAPAAPPKS